MRRSLGALVIQPLTWRGTTANSQKIDLTTTGTVLYFQTQKLKDGSHTIDITVTTANHSNFFIVDYFSVTPPAGGVSSGGGTTSSTPSSTVTSSNTPVVHADLTCRIVGGVLGGIVGIIILVIVVWYIRRRRARGDQASELEKPIPRDAVAGGGP